MSPDSGSVSRQDSLPGRPNAQVYAVYGAEPEVQAYAMAKYSRSALSMKESLREINEQKAEKFLNTFYFQYGHRSIADLAHVAFAIEQLSLLAAIAVVDEQRWDGQERSTRYQDFKKSGYYTPAFAARETGVVYREFMESLFAEYREISERSFEYLRERTPKPDDMAPDFYERTLRARAFDIARYLLPLATNTSLGQIVNARTLENQVARLLSHPHAEVRSVGEQLKSAAGEPAYNVRQGEFRKLIDLLAAHDKALARQVEEMLLKPVRVSPTLVKYANPSEYEMATRRELRQAAAELMGDAPVELAAPLQLLEPEPLDVELAATLLYEHTHYPYRQIRDVVEDLGKSQRYEIIDLGLRHRGQHDELLRPFCAGQGFRFDVLMDIGGYRDLHRHRRCIQVAQDFTTRHGYDTPEEIVRAGLEPRYDATMERAADLADWIAAANDPEAGQNANYCIPLGYRKRVLFKMDLAEVVYISELRTAPAGHFSYRQIAWQMYRAVARKHPGLAQYFRVHDPSQPVDLLKR